MLVEATGWSEVGNNEGAGGSDKTVCGENKKKWRASVHKTEAIS